jgi:hypothetical protein
MRIWSLRLLALILLAAAFWLPTYFFQQRTGLYRCGADACDIGLEDGVVWATGNPIAIVTGERSKDGLLVRRYGIKGLFTRKGVPVALAWLCGLFLPIFLAAGAAIALLVRPEPGQQRLS